MDSPHKKNPRWFYTRERNFTLGFRKPAGQKTKIQTRPSTTVVVMSHEARNVPGIWMTSHSFDRLGSLALEQSRTHVLKDPIIHDHNIRRHFYARCDRLWEIKEERELKLSVRVFAIIHDLINGGTTLPGTSRPAGRGGNGVSEDHTAWRIGHKIDGEVSLWNLGMLWTLSGIYSDIKKTRCYNLKIQKLFFKL